MAQGKKVLLSFVVLAGLMLFAAACQGAGDETGDDKTVNPLVGVWSQSSSIDDVFGQFTVDGGFAFAPIYSDLEKFPTISGTYTYEESVLTLNVTPDPAFPQECSGETARYTVVLDSAGGFTLEDLEWECDFFKYLSSENYPWVAYTE